MSSKLAILLLVIMAILNFIVLSTFSIVNAALTTAIGVFFSFAWFFVSTKVLADKKSTNPSDQSTSFKDYVFLIGPGFVYYSTVCGVAVSVYILT